MFDKELFATLLKSAKGDRSINQYALNSGVSASHISRLMREMLETPPSPDIIKLLSKKAANNITYEQLMHAAGYITEDTSTPHKNEIQTIAAHHDGDEWTEEELEEIERFKEFVRMKRIKQGGNKQE